MIGLERTQVDKLAILQSHDHFRHWESLDDTRLCVMCDRSFAGHEVLLSRGREGWELHCPTTDCQSHVHQWVYPGNPLGNGAPGADWWQALGQPRDQEAQAV